MGWTVPPSSRVGWVVLSCPLATWRHEGGKDSNPSFGIRIDDARSQCVCLSCDWGGSITDLFTELVMRLPVGTVERKQAVKIMNGIEVTKLREPMLKPQSQEKANTDPYFTDTWIKSFPMATVVNEAMAYLLSRKVSALDADAMHIRYDPVSRRICFPIYDWNGNLRGMQGRYITEPSGTGGPKYLFYKYQGASCGHEVMLGENLVEPALPLLLVEGVFDYAALFPFTKQVMVLWGCRVNEQRIKRLSRCTKIYTVFDNDKAGNDARERLRNCDLDITNLVIPLSSNDVGELPEDGLKILADMVDSYGKLG